MNNKTTKDKLEKFHKLGKNIAALRKEKSFSQNQLAEKLNISREHLAKIETAKRAASLDLLIDISDILEIDIKDLFDF